MVGCTTCLGYARAQVTSDEIFVPLQLRLDHDEGEVGLGIHVPRHLFDLFDLLLYALRDALEDAVGRPAARNRVRNLWPRMKTRSYSKSSGADLSATQARVKAWRSRVSRGTASKLGSTSRRMSSMSMAPIEDVQIIWGAWMGTWGRCNLPGPGVGLRVASARALKHSTRFLGLKF